ncbi:MAG: hypothetical protein ACYDEJ_08985 [Desulfitobacteriaceae bacterium]
MLGLGNPAVGDGAGLSQGIVHAGAILMLNKINILNRESFLIVIVWGNNEGGSWEYIIVNVKGQDP